MPEATAIPIPIPVAMLDQKLTAPGSPFEIIETDVRGVATRVWKNAPPSLRAIVEASRQFAARDYLIYEDERLTYADHYGQVTALAHALISQFGIRKGDRVALAMRNYPEWPVVFWATVAVGAIIVPLNAWWTAAELGYALRDSGARLLFADGERARVLGTSTRDISHLEAVIVARAEDDLPAGGIPLASLLAADSAAAELPAVDIHPDDDATLFYTSGTTGNPKGAVSTHRNICTNQVSGVYLRARTEYRYGREPVPPTEQMGQLISAPLFHVTGSLSMLCGSTIAGSKIVFMYKWDADRAIQLIARERLNSFGGVPSMPLQVIESPLFGQHDTSSIRAVLYGGAPPSPELAKLVKAAFPNSSASNGYGLTETSALTTANIGDDYLAKPKSAGLPAPVSQVKIVDADGHPVAAGKIGEIWISGPQVIRGYWNKPEANAASFSDGWLHTGDLGYLDDEGFLFVVDRAKDMLIRGGENIYCIEVEDALYQHPDVLDVAVVGIPDRVLGEQVGAMVQARVGSAVDEAALQAHVRARLAAFKVPVRIAFSATPLPRNANGKIMKTEVKRAMGLV